MTVCVCMCVCLYECDVCGLKYKRAHICSFFAVKKLKNNEIAILKTHAVNSLLWLLNIATKMVTYEGWP